MRALTISTNGTNRAMRAAEHLRAAMLECLDVMPLLPQWAHTDAVESMAREILDLNTLNDLSLPDEKLRPLAEHVWAAMREAKHIFEPTAPDLCHIVFLLACEFIVDMHGDDHNRASRLPEAQAAVTQFFGRLGFGFKPIK